MRGVSIYFPAGDFGDVLRRYEEGRQQNYQTHNEVARLIHDLWNNNLRVNIFSFVTPQVGEERLPHGSRVVNLGAKNFGVQSILSKAVDRDDSETVIVHFPSRELLKAAAAKQRRIFVVLASSFNNTGMRATLSRWRTVRLLNDRRFELVSNHCLPATEHLAELGVNRDKLIPWDIAHPHNPSSLPAKELTERTMYEGIYAGSITEDKGIGDLIRACAVLRREGLDVQFSLAGLGDIEAMRGLATSLGVSDLIVFLQQIGNEEVTKRMRAADLVVVPSRTKYPEGFPLSLFEAIASRTPIVCSNHPMFRPVMIDGQSASVFPAGDHVAFAAALRRTLSDARLYAMLSANASRTWQSLEGPADWRTLMLKWVVEGTESAWIHERMLVNQHRLATASRPRDAVRSIAGS